MNEILLVIIVVAIMVLTSLTLNRVKKPMQSYIRIGMAIALMVLVWLFSDIGNYPVKVILSLLVISNTVKEFVSLRKLHTS
jgi:hypothetical protein